MLRKVILLFLFLFCFEVQASETDLVVSEIMYDVSGSDTSHEWIELYNTGTEDLVVSSTWRFFDSANHKINLYQGTSTIASTSFFILADNGERFLLDYPDFEGNIFDTVINLPNASSSLAISFDEGATHSLIEDYNSSWGANGNGFSLEKINLLASSTDNWQESSILGGTPGKINSEKQEEEILIEDKPAEETRQTWSQLIINELMPNPIGSDDDEWVELYNNGSEILNLEGLKIKDNSTRIFTIDIDSGLDLNLSPYSYLLIPKSISGISLNNSNGDSIIIIDLDGNIIDSVSYSEAALENRSYALSDNYFVWTKTPSPGEFNKISVNQKPIAQIGVEQSDFLVGEKIAFSATYSYDPEGEDLDYLWEFGDSKISTKENVKHIFNELGSYIVRLTVTDTEGAYDVVEYPINIYQTEKTSSADDLIKEEEIFVDLVEDDLIISEFIPNPIGSDDGEWIELYNNSNKDIDLYGWKLDDEDGGSKPWQFTTSTIILSKGYLLLDRAKTKITLNNTNDSVRILNSSGEVFQEVAYEKIPEGKSYAWDNINNEWSINEPSPGVENIFEMAGNTNFVYSVSELGEVDLKSELTVQGVALNNTDQTVSSLYLADYNFDDINFEELIEIYSYNKNFPEIKVGELVTAQGQISKIGDLPRLKIKTEQDIWKNGLKINLSEPEIIEVEDIDEDLLGTYLSIRGIVVKKSGKNIYVSSDIEGEDLLRVYIKSSTKDLEIKKGSEIIVSGILSETESGFKLVPFGIDNIAVSKQVLGEKINAEPKEMTDLSTSTSKVTTKNNKNSVKNILIFILIGLVISSFIYYIKNKKRKD